MDRAQAGRNPKSEGEHSHAGQHGLLSKHAHAELHVEEGCTDTGAEERSTGAPDVVGGGDGVESVAGARPPPREAAINVAVEELFEVCQDDKRVRAADHKRG